MTNYLLNKQQVVKINDCTSEIITINIGVSQGTILWPLLILIYINDIFDILGEVSVIWYANDSIFYSQKTTWDFAYSKMNNQFKPHQWLLQNKLILNID